MLWSTLLSSAKVARTDWSPSTHHKLQEPTTREGGSFEMAPGKLTETEGSSSTSLGSTLDKWKLLHRKRVLKMSCSPKGKRKEETPAHGPRIQEGTAREESVEEDRADPEKWTTPEKA